MFAQGLEKHHPLPISRPLNRLETCNGTCANLHHVQTFQINRQISDRSQSRAELHGAQTDLRPR